MGRVAGVSLAACVSGALVMWLIGSIWYGLLFQEAWMASERISAADFEGSNPAWMVLGVIVSLVLSFAIGWLRHKTGTTGKEGAVSLGLALSLLIAVPVLAYDFVYLPFHSATGLLVNGGHAVAGFVAAALVHSFFE